MADRICTRFIDDDGLDIGCHLVSKEYLLENYPHLVPWIKTPALWVWGNNFNGQLATNDGVFASSPVQTISGGTNWKQVSAKAFNSAGIKTDGTLWTWGINANGQTGNQSAATGFSSPVQTVSNVTTWKQVSVGGGAMSAIKTDGTLWTWGYNQFGQLGDGTIVSASSPVQTVSNVATWKKVSSGYQHVAAVKIDGTLWLWGRGTGGLLGNNAITNRSSPVQTVSNVTTWKQVSVGVKSTAAIKTDGTLWAWGCNGYGELGNNDTVARSSPVQTVSNVNTWKQVSAGAYFTTAIKTDGTLWTWGYNGAGQLGTNNITNRSSPVQTVSGGNNWFKVETYGNPAAIKTDGTLWLWGKNYYGQMGINNTNNISSPIQTITAGTDWKEVSPGATMHAIRDEGKF